ncbi:MAG: adenylate/guanylate cyclase domain-containing protein [Burkholderiales bacterium]|nr:adenylate/guanylate cyclase domain-containing protein [Burkholderiales bacterium]
MARRLLRNLRFSTRERLLRTRGGRVALGATKVAARYVIPMLPVLAVLFALGVAYALTLTSPWQTLHQTEFDLLTVATAPREQQLPITIVGIDDTSMQVTERQWPWPRAWHAKLIDTLTRQGAAVVAFDVVFDSPTDEENDGAMAQAIHRAGNVILARTVAEELSPHGDVLLRMKIDERPLRRFLDAGATMALVDVPPDPDLAIRRQPTADDALWRVVCKMLAARAEGVTPDLATSDDRRIHYYGPRNTFQYVSYVQALDADNSLPPNFFNGQVVLVGRTSLAASNLNTQPDTFPTPYTRINSQLTPGIEIHASLIEAAIRHQPLVEMPAYLVWGLALLSGSLLSLAGRGGRFMFVPLTGVALIAALVVSDVALFRYQGRWLPAVPALTTVIIVFVERFVFVYLAERRQRVAIRKMFAMYVPPKVVAELESQPDKLTLGGQQRDITILFTDLADFTSIAEAMEPLAVSRLLNRYFSIMTRIVFEHEGTLDKFIGDAIMAFWGAPLDDPQQAARAVACSRALQAATATLNAEFRARGLYELTTRVGIHTGSAVVGNLGSPERFSYTALGDSVNLASRLEGTNKIYGTGILMSEQTALAAKAPCRRVDRVRVKGKLTAVDLFTPCDDASLIELTERAWQHYLARQWAEAGQVWEEIAARWPHDTLVPVFRARLAEPMPPDDWDGCRMERRSRK